MKALIIKVYGVVQGVGFRPFVYRIANKFGISGFVRNESWGVRIFAQGEDEKIQNFLRSLRDEHPKAAVIESIETEETEPRKGVNSFVIEKSATADTIGLMPPDLATCDDCLSELFDPADRRYLYPFINCTNCGPRFTIVRKLPYDRPRTTMAKFNMCSDCRKEYENPLDRRYHAQPVSCAKCGPHYYLSIKNGKKFNNTNLIDSDAIEFAARLVSSGKIIAMQGIGGFHLICSARNDDAIARLREWKRRPTKPFAVMAANISSVKEIAHATQFEISQLSSPYAPIMLLRKRQENSISRLIAPGLSRIGVMLPYAPAHHMLFRMEAPDVIIATSGNRRDEPIAKDPEDAMTRLDIADAILWYDREIHNRVDDSVGFELDGELILMRRARGFTPSRYQLSVKCEPAVAFGADMKGGIAITDGKFIYPSQYLGEMEDPLAQDFLIETVNKFLEWLEIKPKAVIVDKHPDYHSRRLGIAFAKELGIPCFTVQHHKSHLWAVIAEQGIQEPVAAAIFDGTGYGDDGNIWGGEFFTASPEGTINRVGHVRIIPQPGGDAAAKKITRMALAYLIRIFGDDARKLSLPLFERITDRELEFVKRVVEQSKPPLTTSMGRFFDAAAAIAGVAFENDYEAEAPMMLESLAYPDITVKPYAYQVLEKEDLIELNFDPTLKELSRDTEKKKPKEEIATRFHLTVAHATAMVLGILSEKYGVRIAAVSGGVFQNKTLLWMLKKLLSGKIELVYPLLNPANDQGIAVGQIMAFALGQVEPLKS
ncbi:carbamoyltransferase HypF [bacterium]|nr:carbamoyltransferase HypF [bacterium]